MAKGFSQSPGVVFNETYAPTAKVPSVKTLSNISAQDDLVVHQADCSSAFLNADIDHVQYMYPPPNTVKDPNLVWKLKKSIY